MVTKVTNCWFLRYTFTLKIPVVRVQVLYRNMYYSIVNWKWSCGLHTNSAELLNWWVFIDSWDHITSFNARFGLLLLNPSYLWNIWSESKNILVSVVYACFNYVYSSSQTACWSVGLYILYCSIIYKKKRMHAHIQFMLLSKATGLHWIAAILIWLSKS